LKSVPPQVVQCMDDAAATDWTLVLAHAKGAKADGTLPSAFGASIETDGYYDRVFLEPRAVSDTFELLLGLRSAGWQTYSVPLVRLAQREASPPPSPATALVLTLANIRRDGELEAIADLTNRKVEYWASHGSKDFVILHPQEQSLTE